MLGAGVTSAGVTSAGVTSAGVVHGVGRSLVGNLRLVWWLPS